MSDEGTILLAEARQVAWNTEKAATTVREALTVLGLPGRPFHLLRLGENALYKVEGTDLLLRVARPTMSEDRVRRALVAATMLGERGIPVAQPATIPEAEAPLVLPSGIVSVWQYYPSLPSGDISFGAVGKLLRALHNHGSDVAPLLDEWDPLSLIRQRLRNVEKIGTPASWTAELRRRLQIAEQNIRSLQPLLSVGVIHGDAHTGNVLNTHRGLILIDLDDLCIGPREVDLVPTLVQLRRLSVTKKDWKSFLQGYGIEDPSVLDNSPLASLRELHMTTWLLQQYGLDDELNKELELRIFSLHECGSWTRWHPR